MLNHNYIGSEHILLGLVHEGDGVAAQILVKLGADMHRLRQQVIQLLHGHPAEEPVSVRSAERELRLLPGVRARLEAVEERLTAIEQRVGAGPDISDLDEQIAQVRREKESAPEMSIVRCRVPADSRPVSSTFSSAAQLMSASSAKVMTGPDSPAVTEACSSSAATSSRSVLRAGGLAGWRAEPPSRDDRRGPNGKVTAVGVGARAWSKVSKQGTRRSRQVKVNTRKTLPSSAVDWRGSCTRSSPPQRLSAAQPHRRRSPARTTKVPSSSTASWALR